MKFLPEKNPLFLKKYLPLAGEGELKYSIKKVCAGGLVF